MIPNSLPGGFSLEEWQIRMVLPHRPPVLQLDRVDFCPNTLDRLEASKALAGADSMVVRGPRTRPYLAPGGIIEALAQCSGLLLRLRWLNHQGVDLAAFAAGDCGQIEGLDIPRSVLAESQATFSVSAIPGRVIHLGTKLVLSRGDMHRFDGVASSSEKVVSAQIMLNFPRLIGELRHVA